MSYKVDHLVWSSSQLTYGDELTNTRLFQWHPGGVLGEKIGDDFQLSEFHLIFSMSDAE
jgi:hypothetical protein